MRRRRGGTQHHNTQGQGPTDTQGRIRITEIHYDTPSEEAPPLPYAPTRYRLCVAVLVGLGALFKYLLISPTSSTLTPLLLSVHPIDLPFCVAAVVAGATLSYWICLPYPAHWMWPDPFLPLEHRFMVWQYPSSNSTRVLGLGILLVGILGMLWSALALGGSWSPLGAPVWSGSDGSAAGSGGLVTAGPYAYIRHPMYLCNFVIAVGLFCVSGNGAVGGSWMLLALSLGLRMFSEEEGMRLIVAASNNEEHHGAFHRWMNATGMLLPNIVWSQLRL